MKIYKGEKYERNLELLKKFQVLIKDQDATTNSVALTLAYEYGITPERVKQIYNNYIRKGVVSK